MHKTTVLLLLACGLLCGVGADRPYDFSLEVGYKSEVLARLSGQKS
jgi:hypothetical protein